MRFEQEKKRRIVQYLLEKIEEGHDSLTKCVSEAFQINQTTVHSYVKELLEQNIIRRVRRGSYELVSQSAGYKLRRSRGDLNTDTYAFDLCLKERIAGYGANVQDIWAYAFSEMVNNVMDHSQAEELEIVVKQNYLKTSVIIADNGIGIFRKIKEHFGFSSLDEAICELFKGKLTTDSENHSGEGIFFSSKLMDFFLIVSSEKVFTNNKFDYNTVLNIPSARQQGTCVLMELSNFTQKQAHEIFDLYANVEGGFTKTRVPLKNMFDTSPVSRSQAKRICNRLDHFQEVLLDFEGIDWMGQGFAHQLFVVFAANHPEIVLTPVNMNEAVTKMYQHVRKS